VADQSEMLGIHNTNPNSGSRLLPPDTIARQQH
jgi:hypothetical protein